MIQFYLPAGQKCTAWTKKLLFIFGRMFLSSIFSMTFKCYDINMVPYCFHFTAHRPVSVHGQTPWGTPSRQREGTVCIIIVAQWTQRLKSLKVWFLDKNDVSIVNRQLSQPQWNAHGSTFAPNLCGHKPKYVGTSPQFVTFTLTVCSSIVAQATLHMCVFISPWGNKPERQPNNKSL